MWVDGHCAGESIFPAISQLSAENNEKKLKKTCKPVVVTDNNRHLFVLAATQSVQLL